MNVQSLVVLFPELKGKRFDDLVDDIKKNGLVHPIVRHEGQILDGRARLRACKLAKVEPRFVDYSSLKLECAPDEYLWSANVQRRQLTADQRTALVFQWEKVLKADAKARQLAGLNKGAKTGTALPPAPSTRHALADKAFVTTHKIQQMESVRKHAPHLSKKVASGKMKLKDAAKVASKKVIPIRKSTVKMVTVTQAVRKIMRTFTEDVQQIVKHVEDKKALYEILNNEVTAYCNRLVAAQKKAA